MKKSKKLTDKPRKSMTTFKILMTDKYSPYYFSYKIRASADFSIHTLAQHLIKSARKSEW